MRFFPTPGAFLSAIAGMVAQSNLRSLIGPSAPIGPSPGFRKRASSRGKKMMKNPPNHTGWFQRHATLWHPPITERMLMRHGWYRRKLRKRGIDMRAAADAKNAMVLR